MRGGKRSENEGLFDWFKQVGAVDDDEELRKAVGTETALYVVFLKYAYQLFGVVSVLNVAFLWLFVTGVPKPEDDFRLDSNPGQYSLQALTILNVTATPPKVWICFFNTMLTLTALILYLLYLYMNKYHKKVDHKDLLNTIQTNLVPVLSKDHDELVDLSDVAQHPDLLVDNDMRTQIFSEAEIAKHTVHLSGVGRDIPAIDVENAISQVFSELIRLDNLPEDQIISIHSIQDLTKAEELLKKLKQAEANLASA